MKKLFSFIIVAIISFTCAFAQNDEKVNIDFGADVVSQYIWRGQHLGNSAIQPSVNITFDKPGITLGAWSSVNMAGICDSQTEFLTDFDIYLDYTVGKFSVGAQDYWFADMNGYNKYWTKMYNKNSGSHNLEAYLKYDFGFLSASWYTVLAGSDHKPNSGDRNFSSYVELKAPWSLNSINGDIAVGANPWNDSFTSFHKGFTVTNITLTACKSIINGKLPVYGQVVFNPQSERTYFVFGLTL